MGDHIPAWAVEPNHSSRSRLKLTSRSVDGNGSTDDSWPLHKAAYLLGRNGQAVDICIAHKSASRVHACLAYDDAGDLYLVDLGSAHGTFLNGKRLQKDAKAKVVSGDSFSFAACPTVYSVATADHDPAATADAERDSHAANGMAAAPSSALDKGGDRHGAGTGEAGREGRTGREAQDAASRHSPISHKVHSRWHRSRSSDSAEARPSKQRQQRPSEQRQQSVDEARRSPVHSTRQEGDPRGRHGPARHGRHRSPVPHRPSPVPTRPQVTSAGHRSRRSASPAGSRKRHRHRSRHRSRSRSYSRSRSRSPARQRRRERNDSSAAQQQRERQAGFREPPAPVAAAAPVPAGNPIDIVRAMMGVPAGGTGFAVEQKKKLLWGSKKAEAPVQGPVAGHNRWDTAEFTSNADKDKFQRLMGVKRTDETGPPAMSADGQLFDRHVPQREQQERLEGDLERSFLEGVRRGARGAVGLGL